MIESDQPGSVEDRTHFFLPSVSERLERAPHVTPGISHEIARILKSGNTVGDRNGLIHRQESKIELACSGMITAIEERLNLGALIGCAVRQRVDARAYPQRQ